MWNFSQSFHDSHKSTRFLGFKISMVFVNPKIQCFYSAKSIRYKNQMNGFNLKNQFGHYYLSFDSILKSYKVMVISIKNK